MISGPSLLVDQILLLSGAASISELVETRWEGERSPSLRSDNPSADTPSFEVYLKHSPLNKHSPALKIYWSSLHSRIRFLPKRYRYFIDPSELVANGRTQTFLGVLYSCLSCDVDPSLKDQKVLVEVVRLSRMKEGTIIRYIGYSGLCSLSCWGRKDFGGFCWAKGKGCCELAINVFDDDGRVSAL